MCAANPCARQLGRGSICNGYSVTVRDEDIASANGSLSYHRVVSGELWDAHNNRLPAAWPRTGAPVCSPTGRVAHNNLECPDLQRLFRQGVG